jgi:hypothetical protein
LGSRGVEDPGVVWDATRGLAKDIGREKVPQVAAGARAHRDDGKGRCPRDGSNDWGGDAFDFNCEGALILVGADSGHDCARFRQGAANGAQTSQAVFLRDESRVAHDGDPFASHGGDDVGVLGAVDRVGTGPGWIEGGALGPVGVDVVDLGLAEAEMRGRDLGVAGCKGGAMARYDDVDARCLGRVRDGLPIQFGQLELAIERTDVADLKYHLGFPGCRCGG